jgi:hypothetical protein
MDQKSSIAWIFAKYFDFLIYVKYLEIKDLLKI